MSRENKKDEIISNPSTPVSGDINGDGRVTAADSRLILRYANGYDDGLSDAQIGMMDSDGDGNVSDSDAQFNLGTAAQLNEYSPIMNNGNQESDTPENTTPAEESDAETVNPYQDILDKYLEEYAAIGKFEYDPNNDLSQYYGRQYRNAALLNQQNALASGGSGYSSTKQALANSAYNSTIEQLGDVQNDLYQLALESYQQERANALQDVELARALYNDDEDRRYQQWYMDNTEAEQKRDQGNIEADRVLNYASLGAAYGNYDKLAEITGLDFSSQETRDKFNDAYTLFQATGDLSGFKEMDIDTSYLEKERSKEEAVLAASYGDYSGLADYGIDISKLTEQDNLQMALYLAEFGDFSRLEELLGADLSDAEYANKLEIGITAAQAGDYSYLEGMGFDTSFLKQLNTTELASASRTGSGGGGSSSSSSSSSKYLSQSNYDDALEAYNVGGISNLESYCYYLSSKGYTDSQITEILKYVEKQTGESTSSIASTTNNSDKSDASYAKNATLGDTGLPLFVDYIQMNLKK